MHPQAMAQQAMKHARQVCIAGLPPTANEQSVATYCSQVMAAIGGNSSGPGDAVVNVDLNHEKKFAIVEMRSVEEASNAMALHGIIVEGSPVVVGRPSDYDHFLAAALGPCYPNPNLNLAAVGLTPHCARGLGGSDRVYVGGIPDHFTEAQIREVLETFGTLRCFEFVKDNGTGESTSNAFCAYQDPLVTDNACLFLNDITLGHETHLIVKRAYPCGYQDELQRENMPLQAPQELLQSAPPMVRRPSDYNPSLTAALGPSQPDPNLNLSAIGLPPGSPGELEGSPGELEGSDGELEGSDCVFVGGLPSYFTEAEKRDVMESLGPLRCFHLLIDRDTGNPKGHFCAYQDPSVTDILCSGIDGMKMGDHTLVVRRAYQDGSQHTLEPENIQASAAGKE